MCQIPSMYLLDSDVIFFFSADRIMLRTRIGTNFAALQKHGHDSKWMNEFEHNLVSIYRCGFQGFILKMKK